jgi:glutamine synthetase
MNLDEVKALIDEKTIEFFLCSFVEMTGAPKAKVVPAHHIDSMAVDGAGFAGYAAGHIGQMPNQPDMASIPDFDSLAVVPWRPNMAWVAGNVELDGKAWPYCPRTILRNQLAKLTEKGLTFNVGVEPEFMVLKQDEQGGFIPWDALDKLGKPCYDLRALHRNLDMMTRLLTYMKDLGWYPYANDHEDATCQFELNWKYSDALTTADRHTFFKWMVKTVAEEYGRVATFMDKPFQNLTGNGAHFHMSLWDGEQNLFLDEGDENGLSQTAYWFIGGVLQHAKALTAVTNPIVNSYKRLIRGAPRSGATWAPVYITYGGSNRTQMIRIPGPGDVECRTLGGSANPYLSAAAMLAAGMDGIENQIDPGPRNDDNLYEVPETELKAREIGFLPTTLAEAIDHLEADPVIRAALGPEYAPYFIAAKREEWNNFNRSVSAWETENYLELY